MVTARILVADDEAEIRNLLVKYLERDGYSVDAVSGGAQALSLFSSRRYDLVILDLMMPDVDGYEVCSRIRAESGAPVIILSAKDAEADKVSGLMLGADDYVTKPFGMSELLARVRAHLRRADLSRVGDRRAAREAIEPRAGIAVDIERHAVTKDGREVALTPKEFDLLAYLMRSPGQVFTKAQIFRAVWGDLEVEDPNTVMVHVRRLRTRIESDPSSPVIIRTVHGIGYSFAED